jgi:hypothetical protein
MIGRALAVGALALAIGGEAHAETKEPETVEQARVDAKIRIEQAIANLKKHPGRSTTRAKPVKRAKARAEKRDVSPASNSVEQAKTDAKKHDIYGFETGMNFEQAKANAKKYGCALERVDNDQEALHYVCNKNYDPPVDLIFGPHSNKLLFMMVGRSSELPAEIAVQDLCREYTTDCDSYKAGQTVVLDKKTDLRFYVSDHKDGRFVVVLAGYALALQEQREAPGAVIPKR